MTGPDASELLTDVSANEDVVSRARSNACTRRWLRRLGSAVVVVASVVWIVSLVGEATSLDEVRRLAAKISSAGTSADDLLMPDAVEVEKRPPSDYLPGAVEGWIAQGIQPVSGSNGAVVEGNYTPEAEEWALVTPLVVYVQAAQQGGSEGGLIDRTFTRYPNGRTTKVLGGVEVATGFSADGWSYCIGWVKDGKVFTLEATYRYRKPASDSEAPLRDAALEMAEYIMAHKPGQGGAE